MREMRASDNFCKNGPPQDICRRDLQVNTTGLASVNSAGTGRGNAAASNSSMSDDGRVVVFSSPATDLAPSGARTVI
jgi:hypothetical protein